MKLLNLVEEATQGMKKFIKKCDRNNPQAADTIRNLFKTVNKSPKFMLPDGGRLLNDNLKGIPESFHLPFPEIVIEYTVSDDPTGTNVFDQLKHKVDQVSSTKRIIYAKEDQDGTITIISILHLQEPTGPRWSVYPGVAVLIPITPEEREAKGEEPLAFFGEEVAGSPLEINYEYGIKLLEGYSDTVKMNLDNAQMTHMVESMRLDLHGEIHTLLEFVEALSCSNVRCAKFRSRVVSTTKLKDPYKDHVYNVLMVDSTPVGMSNSENTTSHTNHDGSRHPREHLRRGHIRRLQSGEKIWVQAHIVNPGVGGVVEKSYAVKAG